MFKDAEREWRFYLGIDNDTLWSIIRDNIPELLIALTALYKSYLDIPQT